MGGRNYVPKALRGIQVELLPSKELKAVVDFDGLEKYLKEKIGDEDFFMDEAVRNLDFQKMKDFVSGIENTQRMYPDFKLSSLRVDESLRNTTTIAYARYFNNSIAVNPRDFKTGGTKIANYGSDSGWHPKSNNDYAQVGAHEMTHIIDNQLAHQMIKNRTGVVHYGSSKKSHWNTANKEAIDKAIKDEKNIYRKEGNRPPGKEFLIERNVSRYANTNAYETLAEAHADVFSNGAKASRLSREILKNYQEIYRREMNK